MGGFFGDFNSVLLLWFGQLDACWGMPTGMQDARKDAGCPQGCGMLRAGSACRSTPGLSALGASCGGSGDAAQPLTGIAAKVCSNVFPCMLQPGMKPDVLHSWVRSREHQTGKIPSDFISKGVCRAAIPWQLFTGFHQGTRLPGTATTVIIEIGIFIARKLVVCSPAEPCCVGWAENGLWMGHLRGEKGKKKHPWHFFSTGGKYFCLCLTW